MKNFHLIHNLYHALLAVYGEPVTFADVAIGDKPVEEVHKEIVDSLTKTEKPPLRFLTSKGFGLRQLLLRAKGLPSFPSLRSGGMMATRQKSTISLKK